MSVKHPQPYLVKAENINVTFARRKILDAVSFHVLPNEIITVIGPNGAGKSTLLRVLLGLQKPDVGQVVRAKNLKIGYMPQKVAIDRTLPLTVKRFLNLQKPTATHLLKIAKDTNIETLLEKPVQRLSGGESQRVLLANAILSSPNLLVLDEPVQNLDVKSQSDFYALLTKIRRDLKCAVVMVSHDLHLVMKTSDRVICLNHHVCCSGQPEVVQVNPDYLRLFGPETLQQVAFYTHHHDHSHDETGNRVEIKSIKKLKRKKK